MFLGGVLRDRCGGGDKGKRKFHFGCAECDVPGEHSREHVGLELKNKVWEYRVKNIRLKVVIKQRAWLG